MLIAGYSTKIAIFVKQPLIVTFFLKRRYVARGIAGIKATRYKNAAGSRYWSIICLPAVLFGPSPSYPVSMWG